MIGMNILVLRVGVESECLILAGILIWLDLEQCHMEDLDLGLIAFYSTC